MAVRCQRPGCDRTGEYQLKLTFRQTAPLGWTPEKGPPRVGFTVKCEGLWCDVDRKAAKLANILDVPMKLQVTNWFVTRHLGGCAFDETTLDWERVATPETDEAPSLLVRM